MSNPGSVKLDLSKLKLAFAEEFDRLSLYDPAQGGSTGWKTNYAHGSQYGEWEWNSRTQGSELQVYTDKAFKGTGTTSLGLDPFSIADGALTITATKVDKATAAKMGDHTWSSGLLTTEKSFAQTYGYFEIRAKLPAGEGMWPAFWLLPEGGGDKTELDVFEQTGGRTVIQTVHGADGGHTVFGEDVETNTTAFHTYGVMWTEKTITFYIDGVETGTMATPSTMHRPMYMLVNLAVSADGWAGTPKADATSAQMQIDYIRAYSLADADVGKTIVGTDGADTLVGTAGADTMQGGAGDDIYTVNHARDAVVEKAGGGIDTVRSYVDYTAPANVENVTLLGFANLNATGNELDNLLTGNDGKNVLRGLGGNDTLIGGADGDTLIGGTGDDTYVIESWYTDYSDKIIELANEGIDTVRSKIDFTLGDNLENLVLTGTDASAGYGNALDNVIVGNDAANRIEGRGGNDTLTGGKGADTFVYWAPGTGRDVITDFGTGDTLDISGYAARGVTPKLTAAGKDVLVEFNSNDTVLLKNVDLSHVKVTATSIAYTDTPVVVTPPKLVEAAPVVTPPVVPAAHVARWSGDMPAGTTKVMSAYNFSLEGTKADTLTLTGIANVWARANDLGNALTGNAGANSLFGGKGNDVLDGGAGADYMQGGAGDDIYIVDNVGDRVVDLSGVDTVRSSITYTLGTGIENLTLTGTANIDATGNSGDNVIVGNAGNNVISAGGGRDTLTGGGGADTFVIKSPGSAVVTDFGADDVIDMSSMLAGGYQRALSVDGADVLIRVSSGDTIRLQNTSLSDLKTTDGGFTYAKGGGDAAMLVSDRPLETVYVARWSSDAPTNGATKVMSAFNYSLEGMKADAVTLTGTAAAWLRANDLGNALTGNAAANSMFGGKGNDVLDGGAGADYMQGGDGDDIYIVDNVGDRVVDASGIDMVRSSISYTLGTGIENLTLTGRANIDATGNRADNVIVGNAGNNVITGGGGRDTLTGGGGSDTFVYRKGSGEITITDFQGSKAGIEADMLRFSGYDKGAYLTHEGDVWHINHAGGSDVIHITGVTQLDAGRDYVFA